ncbi:MAG: tectonin domain-containing protein [Terriglobales bacterium]
MFRTAVRFAICLALSLVFSTLFSLPASAQHFQQVKGTLVSVAAGRNEVFGIGPSGLPWRYNATSKSFAKVTGATGLAQVAVGGGTVSQLDEVWAVAASGKVFRFNFTTKSFDQITGVLSQITVGPGYEDNCHPYEVWGVNSVQSIFRYNYCTSEWEQAVGSLTVVATGGGDVWGINVNGQVFHFLGNTSFHQVTGLYNTPTQLAVGVNDVWVIDNTAQVYRYDPSTGQFNAINDLFLLQIAAGGDGVWATWDGTLARFDPEDNGGSGEFIAVSLDGSCSDVAVGSGAGVFAVNSSHQIFTLVRP